MTDIVDKVLLGQRLTKEEALDLYRTADLLILGYLANTVRGKKHPERVVTYVMDRNINYTNICCSCCKFCAFYKKRGDAGAYVLSLPELFAKIRETIALGGNQILLQGGLNPELGIDYYEQLFAAIKREFPNLWLHALSPPEIVHIARVSGLTIAEVLLRLLSAGLNSIPGGGAEILVDRVRSAVSPRKCTAGEWLEVMREAHLLGMRTTATMMYGHLETLSERIEHLLALRDLQDRTGGFTAFIPWPFQPRNTQLPLEENDGVWYLRTLAISRVVLDNFDNVQASWVTQGSKMAAVALSFGANDMGSTMIEENVVKAAGVHFQLSEADIIGIIIAAGFTPARRNMLYQL